MDPNLRRILILILMVLERLTLTRSDDGELAGLVKQAKDTLNSIE